MDLERIYQEEIGMQDKHPLWKPFNEWCLKEFGIGGKEVPSMYFNCFLEGTKAITGLEGDENRLLLLSDQDTVLAGYWLKAPDSADPLQVPFEVLRPLSNGRYLAILPEYAGEVTLHGKSSTTVTN